MVLARSRTFIGEREFYVLVIDCDDEAGVLGAGGPDVAREGG
jgi:hypothetical protein